MAEEFREWPVYPPRPGLHGPQVTQLYRSSAKDTAMDPKLVELRAPFVVAITGSGKGVGAAIAEAYAHAGASGILLSSRTLDDLQSMRAQINTINEKCDVHFVVCDVTNEDELSNLALECKNRFGRLDVAIINAGVGSKRIKGPDGDQRYPQGILEDTTADFFHVWRTNFGGAYLTARAFLPLLRETVDGAQAMVFISSMASLHNYTDLTSVSYNISKLAVNRLAEHIHDSYAKDGILTHAIHPGCIRDTDGHSSSRWHDIMVDDISLPGAFCVWLTQERRDWLSGRYLSANWDVEKLIEDKEQIVDEDKFKAYLKV
ncbi:Short-chain dehydrogenase/reductase SDR [Penicillium angulare]|uniref:Short-chain dehydrogenase/reductase SDR n=1 Tax=Penicillium angulare TaxID=116970 RepID=UPI002540B857|nr:Short-chain dehydrogenase/reductase SDR [Penicillium angulare]KAJ5273935.1 Short-chain dehydrogenase/reductase SDR [Penicillium angulare]